MGMYSYTPYPDIHTYALIVTKLPVYDIEKERAVIDWTNIFSEDKICPHIYANFIVEIEEGVYYRYMITDLFTMDYEFYLRYEIANPVQELLRAQYIEYQILYLSAKLIWKYNLYLIDFTPKNILLLYRNQYVQLCDFEYEHMKYFSQNIDGSTKTSLLVIQLYFLKMHYMDLSKRVYTQLIREEDMDSDFNIATIQLLKHVNKNKHIQEIEQYMKYLLYGEVNTVMKMVMYNLEIDIESCNPTNLSITLKNLLSDNDYFYLKWIGAHFPYMYKKWSRFHSFEDQEEKEEYLKTIVESITFEIYLMN
jgi:hypothetical protein